MHLISNRLPGFHHGHDVVHCLDTMFEMFEPSNTTAVWGGGTFHVFITFFSRTFGSVVDTFGSAVDTFGVELTFLSRLFHGSFFHPNQLKGSENSPILIG